LALQGCKCWFHWPIQRCGLAFVKPLAGDNACGACRALAISQHVASAGLRERVQVFAPPLPIQWGTHHRQAPRLLLLFGVRTCSVPLRKM
jgi:hypothetical protein